MACGNNILDRGSNNPQNDEYSNTVANYSFTVTGDNIVFGLSCDSGVSIGDWVRMSGTTVVKAQADVIGNSRVVGIAIAKTGATSCDVQTTGVTSSIFAGLLVNTEYFLDPTTPGLMSTTVPTTSGNIVISLGKSLNGTQFSIA